MHPKPNKRVVVISAPKIAKKELLPSIREQVHIIQSDTSSQMINQPLIIPSSLPPNNINNQPMTDPNMISRRIEYEDVEEDAFESMKLRKAMHKLQCRQQQLKDRQAKRIIKQQIRQKQIKSICSKRRMTDRQIIIPKTRKISQENMTNKIMKSTLNEDVIKPKALQFDVNMLDKMVMHSPHRNLQPRNQLNQQYLYKNYVGIGVETVKVIGTVAHGIQHQSLNQNSRKMPFRFIL